MSHVGAFPCTFALRPAVPNKTQKKKRKEVRTGAVTVHTQDHYSYAHALSIVLSFFFYYACEMMGMLAQEQRASALMTLQGLSCFKTSH